ncbi:hypothetical protein BGX30_006518 [Mortierella sp. GBA39]|nr:hypothetical protein BGX30_006518 [Mortierella sp. GBA39]
MPYHAGVTHLTHGDISIVYNEVEDALYFKHPAFDSKLEHYHFEMFKFEMGADEMVRSLALIEPGYRETVFDRKVAPTAAKEE